MKIEIHNRCTDFDSYRAARVKSLFNAESGAEFTLEVDLPIEDDKWKIGVVVGPSGSGKTSLGRKVWGGKRIWNPRWPRDRPIIDAISPKGDFDQVTAALAGVGLGTVPTWLRPYGVLSNGEKFRADLARVLCDRPEKVVIDEFSSVVDRQIAKFGALAFAKAWRRGEGKCILLSCHYDIIEWLEPCWVLDTATGKYAGRGLWRRPRFELEIWQTDWRYWNLFEPHHYLKLPKMIAATNYVGVVEGELVSHLGVSTRPGMREARACRLVVMPEWQGAGVGLRFLNRICEMWLQGQNRYGKAMPVLFHTSHPGLCAALRRMPQWIQVSGGLCGGNKKRSIESMIRSRRRGKNTRDTGYGGHFRAVQGFRYIGDKKERRAQ